MSEYSLHRPTIFRAYLSALCGLVTGHERGMRALGIGSTLLLGIRFFFHKSWRIHNGSNAGKVFLHMKKGDDTRERIVSALTNMNIQVISTHLNIFDNSFIEVSLSVVFPKDFSAENTMTLMANYPEIASIDL